MEFKLAQKVIDLFKIKTMNGWLRFFFFGLVLLPALLMFCFGYWELHQTEEQAYDHLSQTVSVQREVVDQWFQKQSSLVRTLSHLTSVRSLEKDRIAKDFHSFLLGKQDIYSLVFVNKEGITEVDTDSPAGIVLADREYFKRALKGQEAVTDVIIGRASGDPIIIFSSPVYDYNNQFQGLVFGTVKLYTINNIMENNDFGRTGETVLVTNEGKMITKPRFEIEKVQESVLDENRATSWSNIIEDESGLSFFKDYREQEVLAAYQRVLNSNDWTMVGKIDKEEVFEPFYRYLTFLSGVYLLVLLIAWPFNIIMSRKVKNPIRQLLFGARELEQGNQNYRIDLPRIRSAPQEMQLLCETFNRMSEKLQLQVEALQESEQRFRTLVSSMNDMVFTLDQDGRYTGIYGQWMEARGIPAREYLGKTARDILGNDAAEVHEEALTKALSGENAVYEWSYEGRDGTHFYQTSLSPIKNSQGRISEVVSVGREITTLKQMEEQLMYISMHDSLTGLYNRAYFEEEMRRLSDARHNPVGIIVSDLDGLKGINDNFGHQAGDELIKTAAGLLQGCFRDSDVVARIGGDEFVVLLPNCSEELLAQAVQRIQSEFELYSQRHPEKSVSISIGTAIGSQEKTQMEQLFQTADLQMYQNKNKK